MVDERVRCGSAGYTPFYLPFVDQSIQPLELGRIVNPIGKERGLSELYSWSNN